jgi:hypothetical protein
MMMAADGGYDGPPDRQPLNPNENSFQPAD